MKLNKIRLIGLTTAAMGLALLGPSTSSWADHIPGHDPCAPVFPCPLPGEQFFNGGIMFVTLIGPVGDSIITSTTFDITWVSDGATPASDLLIVCVPGFDRHILD